MTDVDEGRRIPLTEIPVVVPEETLGAPGVAIYGGTLMEAEGDAKLSGEAKYLSYSNLLANNAICAAGVRYFLNIASAAEWEVQVDKDNEGDEKAVEVAKKIKYVMHNMKTPWSEVIRRAMMFRFYGFSIQEWTAKRFESGPHAGMVGFKNIAPRSQASIVRWDMKKNGDLEGVMQRSPQTQIEQYLPRGKIIYIVDDSLHDSPEGLGIFRHVIKLHDRLERYEILEGWGFERDLRGTPIGRAPLGELQKLVDQKKLTVAQANAIKLPLETFISNALKGKDTGMVLDSSVYKGTGENNAPTSNTQWSIDLLKGETTSQEEMASAIERINREIARLLGVEQLMLGSDSRGSHALSQDKTQAFGVVIDSALTAVARALEKDFLRPLFELNGWDEKYMPTFRISKAQFREVGDVVGALKDMALAGAPLPINDPSINEIRRMLGLSDQEDQDEDLALALEELPLQGVQAPDADPGSPGPAKGEPKPTGRPGEAGPAEPRTSSDAPGRK